MAKNEEMFSMSYEDAKNKYGTGLGNNKMFMPKEMFDKKQVEYNKTKQEEKPKNNSLVAEKFGNKKNKTWNDVKAENGNDPEKIKDYLNNNPDYKAGNLTKKGMEEFGYAQGEDGKWSIKQPIEDTTTDTTDTTTTKPTTVETTPYTGTDTTTTNTTTTTTTTEDINKKIEELYKQNEDLQNKLNKFQDKKGKFNEKNTIDTMAMYEQKMVEMGAGKFDKDGKFILKDTTKKGWEDYATILSAGLSIIGLSMGIPIIPINFRKITNKDEKDAKIREFQKQYTDIFADSAAKVEDVKSSAKAGKTAKENEEDIKAYSKYKEDVDAYEAKSKIDTDSEKELIDAQTQSDLKKAQQQLVNSEKILQLEQKHARDMTILSDKLSTASAKELTAYSKTGWLVDYIKEARAQGLSDKDIALAISGLNGQTPTQKGLENAKSIVGMITDAAGVGASFLGKK